MTDRSPKPTNEYHRPELSGSATPQSPSPAVVRGQMAEASQELASDGTQPNLTQASDPGKAGGGERRKGRKNGSGSRQGRTEGDDEDGEDQSQEEEDQDEGDVEDEDDDEDDEDDEDEEPQLKSTRLTQHLAPVYRNGDATSASLVAGDKMIIGTHNGNIHVIQLPTFNPLRVYHAHSASATCVSISPFPLPLPSERYESLQRTPTSLTRPASRQSEMTVITPKRHRDITPVPKIPSNDIYIATSSMDGNVCVQSLIDMKDVQLRNFARPVQAVALSPEYKTDRTYLSGGLAGQLILTVGGGPGRSTSTTVDSAAAVATGWLASMGLKDNGGKDTVLHAGEGTINAIKWSLSGKYVVWLNEHGIKIMRSKLHLDHPEAEDAWKRIGHIDRPKTKQWETMASVWKGRAEWIDEKTVESDDLSQSANEGGSASGSASLASGKSRDPSALGKRTIERLLVGWGGTMWIIHIHPSGIGSGQNVGEKTIARAEIAKILHTDCIISGISLYTETRLLVLAFCSSDEEDDGANEEEESEAEAEDIRSPGALRGSSKKDKGKSSTLAVADKHKVPSRRRRKPNVHPPELRIIDLKSQVEVDKHVLGINRFERLSAGDYHLSLLPAQNAASVMASSRGALEALAGIGSDMWNVAINPKALFSSGASIFSRDTSEDGVSISRPASSAETVRVARARAAVQTVHPILSKPGAKIFINSPYDCVVGSKRDLSDHLAWLLEREHYQQAWELLDENPEILTPALDYISEAVPAAPSRQSVGAYVDDFFDDESVADSSHRNLYSSVEKEKRRIGELWIRELIDEGDWVTAGQVCGKVLATPDRWEKWVWTFAGSQKFDEIAKYIPSKPMHPPLPTTIYEVVLGHYIQTDKPRFRELLEAWPTDLFDLGEITTALENQLRYRDVRETSVEDGETGRDWRIVLESLASLHEAGGRQRDALKCYIKLQDADSAFRLIGDSHLADTVVDDIPGFISLRVPSGRLPYMSEKELAAATSEAISLLVDEAQHGLVRPDVVVEQLQERKQYLYIFFYLRGLWKGQGLLEHSKENPERLVMESQSLVDNFADLTVHLFATYERPLLMEFLKVSTSYAFEKAVLECEAFSYYDELVFLYSKTGQMKRALHLIIDRLMDVNKAIEFAKEQDDPDLWEDLLDYSMDKPSFIRALLEQVGTAINPIKLVRRIPEGLEIHGLREGLIHMMKEHELQHSISSGVAKVLRSEVATAQTELRIGQRRGVKFEVAAAVTPPEDSAPGAAAAAAASETAREKGEDGAQTPPEPGECAACHAPFTEYEMETLVGFACGHVFHVSHLLETSGRGGKMDVDLGEGASEAGGRYMVGMKVMRARLLRDRVRRGCPICQPGDA